MVGWGRLGSPVPEEAWYQGETLRTYRAGSNKHRINPGRTS